jgi:hypothetical protein
MDWSVVPILTVLVLGFLALCLLVAAFLLVARRGHRGRAMQSTPGGRWSLPRRLLFAGALLGVLFGWAWVILSLIPGGIPWGGGSDWTGLVAMLATCAALWYFVIRRSQPSSRGTSP